MCSSVAGSAWPMHIDVYKPFAMIDDWDEAIKYFEDRLDDPAFIGPPELANKAYTVSKETMIIYAKYRSWSLSEKHIRINTASPAAIKSPMHDDFNELTVSFPRKNRHGKWVVISYFYRFTTFLLEEGRGRP
ncbi:MAG: hypothetical protein ACOX0T_11110 [Pelotomaculum sp.]